MGILTKRESLHKPWVLHALVLSLITKLRWIPSVMSTLTHSLNGVHDQTVLAIIEWSDVFFILLWTVHFVWEHRKGYLAGLIFSDSQGKDSTRLVFASSLKLTITGGAMYIATLAVSLFFIYHQHRVPSGSLPYISDM